MIHSIVIVFLILATAFAGAHAFATYASLYWYYWWFDIMMHFWGGVLITLGMISLSTFSRFHFTPSLRVLLSLLLVVTLAWEGFEFWAGLWQPEMYLIDTLQDIVVGFSGGLLAYMALTRYTMKKL